MPSRRPDTPRRPCSGSVGKKRTCWAREGSDWCSNHDPAEADRRSAAGRVRHPRFARSVLVGGHTFDRAKAPSIAHLIDRAMNIADSVEGRKLDARDAQAAVAALRLAWQALEAERDRSDRLRWAWEQKQAAESERASQDRGEAPSDDGSSPNGGGDGQETSVPPWMRPRPSN